MIPTEDSKDVQVEVCDGIGDDLESSSSEIRLVDASSSRSDNSPPPPQPSPCSSSTVNNEEPAANKTAATAASKNQEPSDFRPGRLSAVDVLTRIFPNQKKNVIELVLQGCSGDILKAMEQFLSINDAFAMHQNRNRINPHHSNTSSSSNLRLDPINSTSTAFGSNKSAFTPLTPSEAIRPLSFPGQATSIQPLPPASTHFPFPYLNRDFSMSSFSHHPAVQFLMNHHHPTPNFGSLLPPGCTSGCGQCPPPTPPRVSPLSAFRDVRGQQSAVDLSTETTSWRGHPPSSGGKCSE